MVPGKNSLCLIRCRLLFAYERRLRRGCLNHWRAVHEPPRDTSEGRLEGEGTHGGMLKWEVQNS